jgi:hypothetical protein
MYQRGLFLGPSRHAEFGGWTSLHRVLFDSRDSLCAKKEADEINNPAKGIKGIRVGGEPKSELEHFYKCPTCGQSVDMRDLGQVFHHELPGHEPITSDA